MAELQYRSLLLDRPIFFELHYSAMITCFTITQPGRIALLKQCIGDFAAQTYPNRELLIVHDGDAHFDQEIKALIAPLYAVNIRIKMCPPGLGLGALRNIAIAESQGDLVCQWDDDDRYHPQRLELQLHALQSSDSDFCFLGDQLHWFSHTGTLWWDDWSVEPHGMNLIPGTLLCKQDKIPRYPEISRGEDSAICREMLRQGHKFTRLTGVGWCYIYVYHGLNTFGLTHHAAISHLKALTPIRTLSRLTTLKERLAQYQPPPPKMLLTLPDGIVDLARP